MTKGLCNFCGKYKPVVKVVYKDDLYQDHVWCACTKCLEYNTKLVKKEASHDKEEGRGWSKKSY